MAESISICRHNKNGTGYCERLGEYCVEGPCTAEELIEYAPVRHGRWVECDWVEYDSHGECVHYSHGGCVCTNCRNAFKKEFVHNPRVNYCPHCGALMDKEE